MPAASSHILTLENRPPGCVPSDVATAVNTAQRWSGEAEERLQNYLATVNWAMFKDLAVDLTKKNGIVVANFKGKCVEVCVPTKANQVFPN